MVEVTYHCPYCGAVMGIDREGYLADRCVTKEPLDGWEYASTTGDFEDSEARSASGSRTKSGDADGVEFVCLGNAGEGDGCGRTFYLSFVRFEDGREVDPEVPPTEYGDGPRFDFLG